MRNLSDNAIRGAFALNSDEVYLCLLEINSSGLAEPYRLVNNTTDIVHDGQTFTPYPFLMVLGSDDAEQLPEVTLEIDNVDRLLVETIRTVADAPVFTVKLVLASSPDTVEIEISGLVMREVSYDAYKVSGKLYADDIINSRYPADNITVASGYEGLFR